MAGQETISSSMCLRITRRCNAACAFCQAPPTSREELSVAEVGDLSALFGALGVRTVKLSGGEPTMRRDLPDVIRAVAEGGPIPVVVTNGVRLDDETLDACAAAGGEFKFSVHRASRLNDDVLRRRSFDEIVANMARVVDRGIRLSVNTVVTRTSVQVMDDMVDFARRTGAAKISFIPVVERGRARNDSDTYASDTVPRHNGLGPRHPGPPGDQLGMITPQGSRGRRRGGIGAPGPPRRPGPQGE